MAINEIEKKLFRFRKIGLDTMCYIYHFEDNPNFADICTKLLTFTIRNRIELVSSTITLTETVGYARDVKKKRSVKFYRKLLENIANLNLVNVNLDIAEKAGDLRNKYMIKTADSLHIATAIHSDCSVFITNDERLKKVRDIKISLLKELM